MSILCLRPPVCRARFKTSHRNDQAELPTLQRQLATCVCERECDRLWEVVVCGS